MLICICRLFAHMMNEIPTAKKLTDLNARRPRRSQLVDLQSWRNNPLK